MLIAELPAPITRYFSAKAELDTEKLLACFAEDATVWDNGEDRELKGIEQIRQWLTTTVASYALTSDVISAEQRGDEFVTGIVVSGTFPGSPYKFENRFQIKGEKIVGLVIDPVGPLAE